MPQQWKKPQLVQKLSGKEFVDHLAIPKLDSTKLIQQQLSSGGANTALHNELRPTSFQPESSLTDDKLEQLASTMSFQELSLQQDSLQAAYLQDDLATSASEEELERTQLCTMSFQQQSLQQSSLQAAYSIGRFQPDSLTETSLSFENQLTAYLGDELEKTALHTELVGFTCFQLQSSTRACALQRDAYIGSTRALDQQLRALKSRTFLSLIRVIVILMIQSLILHSLSFLFSTTSLTCTSLSFQTSFPFGWAQNLDEKDELLTTFWIRELANKAKINTTCKEENEKHQKLQTILWEQELAELLAHKPCPLDLSDGHLGQELLWENQLQKNTLENENDKKLENKELDKKNFQSLIYKKLVALLQKKHFASAASSQLLGYEAWGKYREASEDSFDKVGDKELLQEELRRQELGCKDLWPAYLWALCPDSFEENSFTEETFANTSLGKETFTESSLTQSSLKESLTANSFSENTFLKNSFSEDSFDKKSFAKKSFDKKSFAQKTFDKTSFDKKSLDKSSFGKSSFGKSSLEESSLAQSSFANSSLEESSFGKSSLEDSSLEESSLQPSSLANSSLKESSLKEKSFEESSFKKSSFNQSSFEERSFGQSSLEESSLKGSFEQSSLKKAALNRAA